MVNGELVIAKGQDDQLAEPSDAPANEGKEIEGRLICPVNVFDHHYSLSSRDKLLEHVQGLRRCRQAEDASKGAPDLIGNLSERCEWFGRRKCLTRPQRPIAARLPLLEK